MSRALNAIVAALILGLSSASPVAADPTGDARAARDKGDYVAALQIYRRAADQGLTYAQFNLGMMYALGRGVPQDYVMAHMWFNLSAAQGMSDAAQQRDLLTQRMIPAQISEAQRLAREWKPKN